MSSIEAFFAYARERQAIKLRRQASLPGPWTTDPILQMYRFTNVFREDDRTTVWFRENVREKHSGAELLLATVVFRWFNRITTGQAIFAQPDLSSGDSSFERMIQEDDTALLRGAISAFCGSGPYVTGAYIIKTPDGYNKLDGVLKCIEWFMEQKHDFATVPTDWREMGEFLANGVNGAVRLEQVWAWLKQFPFLGDFMAYEIVTDLRHTHMLDKAPDIMTWANPGPGATRGIGRIEHGDKDMYNQHRDKDALIAYMRYLFEKSQDPQYWPQKRDGGVWYEAVGYRNPEGVVNDWPAWEMREVEHTLCEFDKYERVKNGEGRPRGRFA